MKLCIILVYLVNRSQRAGETPLKSWLLAKNDGNVITAHWDCMAGLSEAWSHVGALLYAIETGVRMRDSKICTEEKNKWLMLSYLKDIPHLPVILSLIKPFNINFVPKTNSNPPKPLRKKETRKQANSKV